MTDQPFSCYPGQFGLWDCSVKYIPNSFDWFVVDKYAKNTLPPTPTLKEYIFMANVANAAIARAMIAAKTVPMGG